MELVVLYLHSTSNHNEYICDTLEDTLYYIFILHQTTTVLIFANNHVTLYYIFILHQTTTQSRHLHNSHLLYYIFILHQTTTYDKY